MNIKTEISRKAVHLASSLIGISIYFLEPKIYLPILLFISISFIIFDFSRIKSKRINTIY